MADNRIEMEIGLCKSRDREDARQEAAIAVLRGDDPAEAVHRFRMNTSNYRKKMGARLTENIKNKVRNRVGSVHSSRVA